MPAADLTIPEEHRAAVKELLGGAWAKNTKRTYRAGWAAFEGFCRERGRQALPATDATVVLWLADLKESRRFTAGTVGVYLSAIRFMHRLAKLPTPTDSMDVELAVEALRRALGTKPQNQKAPITIPELRKVADQIDRRTFLGKRDVAALLFHFWSAQRREELCATRWVDLSFEKAGLAVLIPKSKTDQRAEGQVIFVPRSSDQQLCAVRALEEWRTAMPKAGWTSPFVFVDLHGAELRALPAWKWVELLKGYVQAAGFDPARYAGHSLRAGYVTQALRQKISTVNVQKVTRHKNAQMLATYYREANPADGTPTADDMLGKEKE